MLVFLYIPTHFIAMGGTPLLTHHLAQVAEYKQWYMQDAI